MRRTSGSVRLLCQRFGDALLVVATRAPRTTEDLDFSFAPTFDAEGRRRFSALGFVDAHNCMAEISGLVFPVPVGSEYLRGVREAVDAMANEPCGLFAAGYGRKPVPFSRVQGFGGGRRPRRCGARGRDRRPENRVRPARREQHGRRGPATPSSPDASELVDEAEVMTTDSHVVNTTTGRNPIGMAVPVEELAPVLERTLRAALADLAPAAVASSTAWCEGVVVFGSTRITQLAATVNAMLVYVAPLSLAILLLAFILSVVTYLVLL